MPVIATDLYGIVTAYTYLGIAFYYIVFDFVSPVSDELSLIIIAWLAHNGLLNVPAGAGVAFLSLYARNILLFYLSRNRTRWINALTERYPVWMANYQQRMSNNLMKTVMVLTFIPKLRIFIPLAAGFGRVEVKRFFFVQGFAIALFILIYYPLGIFFYSGIQSLLLSFEEVDRRYVLAGMVIGTLLLSFVLGRYILRKVR